MAAMEKKDKNLNVPNLRFPEFSGEWEKCKIKQVCDIATGNKNTQDKSDDGIYPFYVRSQTVERINSWSFDGEAILTAGDGVGVGKVFHYSTGKIGVHQRVYILSNFTCDSKYLFHYFSSRFYGRVKRMSAKNSVDSVRMEMIADMPIYLASNDEQHKIGNLMSLLNERIETQKKIIEKLESLIKGLCQKLTEQDNPNTALNETLVCYSSTLQESSVQEAGDYPVYGATGVCGYTNAPEVDGDSILIIKDGASVGITYYASSKYSAIGTLNRLVAKRGYSLRYLYYCLKVFNFAPYRTGLAIPHIYFRDYGKAKVWCPSLDEQQRIADALSKVEQKIAIEKSLLEQLYSQKRFLLRSMFI